MSRSFASYFVAVFLLSVALVFPATAATPPNIILITLDSVRADRVGRPQGLTPSFDDLAKQSIVFQRAYSQTPGTVSSHATILTGLYPQTHRVNDLGSPLAASTPYLPDLLRSHGYRTEAIVGSVLLDPRSGMAPGFDRGFDEYVAGFQPFTTGKDGVSTRSADAVIAHVIQWLTRDTNRAFFLWVHLFDAHAPYSSSYDRGVGRDDAAMGKLLNALHSKKLFDDAIIVVAADHGESLGSHGEETHGVFLYDETVHVPLLLKLPQNQMAAKQVKGRVRLLDIAPSILEAAGIPVPSQMQGQSLLRIAKTTPDADQAVYSRSDYPHDAYGWSPLESWRAGKYLYIRAPKPELYDLIADPAATHNLAQTSKATLDTMAAQLAAFSSHFGVAGNPTALSSSEMQKLASLGYVGMQKSSVPVSAAAGMDPKDQIATANQVNGAMSNLMVVKVETALPVLQRATASQPGAYLAHYGLGLALMQQQKYPTAIEHLHQAIELQPDSAWAHYEMGACLVKTGDFKTAAVHLELASARLPQFREVHLLLAQCYEHLGQSKAAQVEIDKAAQ